MGIIEAELREFIRFISWRMYVHRARRSGMATIGYTEYWAYLRNK